MTIKGPSQCSSPRSSRGSSFLSSYSAKCDPPRGESVWSPFPIFHVVFAYHDIIISHFRVHVRFASSPPSSIVPLFSLSPSLLQWLRGLVIQLNYSSNLFLLLRTDYTFETRLLEREENKVRNGKRIPNLESKRVYPLRIHEEKAPRTLPLLFPAPKKTASSAPITRSSISNYKRGCRRH